MSDRRGIDELGMHAAGIATAAEPVAASRATTLSGVDQAAHRSRAVGAAALVLCIALVVVIAALGNGLRDTTYDFESPGVWLPIDGKITHIALATGTPDARIDLGPTFPSGFSVTADAHLTVIRSSDGTCHLDRLDEAKLNLAKRDPRLDLGDGPCDRYLVAVGGDRVYVVDRQSGSTRQLDDETLGDAAEPVDVPAPVTDAEVDDDGQLVVVGGDDGDEVQVVHGGEGHKSVTVDGKPQAVRVGDRVALVTVDAVQVIDPDGALSEPTALPGEAILEPRIPDQPGGRIPLPLDDGGIALVRLDGEVAETAVDTAGPLVALGPYVYELTDTGANRFADDGEVLEPLSMIGDAVGGPAGGGAVYAAVTTHGRLWVHRDDQDRGWACEADGICTAFQKDDPNVPEVKATEPDQEDPPKTIDPASTVTTDQPTTTETTAAPVVPSDTQATPVTAPAPPPPPPAVVVPPGPVVALAASSLDGQAALSWRPPSGGGLPDAYHVQVRGRGEEGDVPNAGATRTGFAHTVGGLENGQTYDIEVWASVAGIEGPRTTVQVLPSNRTPQDVQMSVDAVRTCEALGEGAGCPRGASGSVLVTWADARGGGVDQYQAGCDANGATLAAAPPVGAGVGRAVVEGPQLTGQTVTCWVQAVGGGRTSASNPIFVVDLPQVTITYDSATATVTVQATNDGRIVVGSVTFDGTAEGIPEGQSTITIGVGDVAPGQHRVSATATNARGSASSTQDIDVVPPPVALTALTRTGRCCDLTATWTGQPPPNGGFTVTVLGIIDDCNVGCGTSGQQGTDGYLIPLSHRNLWQSIVPSLTAGYSPWDVVANITVKVKVAGYDSTERAFTPVRLYPFTALPITESAQLFTDAALTQPKATVTAGVTEAQVLCQVGQGQNPTAYAVYAGNSTTVQSGYVASSDVQMPTPPTPRPDIPTC